VSREPGGGPLIPVLDRKTRYDESSNPKHEINMQVSNQKVVMIHYTLTDDEGEKLDSSMGGEPLAFIQGLGNIISGLENALKGRVKGDRFKVSIDPEEGYGPHDKEKIQPVPRSAFEGVEEVMPGMQFQAQTPEGVQLVTVVDVAGDEVILDGNHPMAGMTLHFDVEVMDVRDATPEEIEHGHVHGPGGHHH
jgi:FKBP-type peptidyl-prolyl cis-trans isomerase SlyD